MKANPTQAPPSPLILRAEATRQPAGLLLRWTQTMRTPSYRVRMGCEGWRSRSAWMGRESVMSSMCPVWPMGTYPRVRYDTRESEGVHQPATTARYRMRSSSMRRRLGDSRSPRSGAVSFAIHHRQSERAMRRPINASRPRRHTYAIAMDSMAMDPSGRRPSHLRRHTVGSRRAGSGTVPEETILRKSMLLSDPGDGPRIRSEQRPRAGAREG